MRIETNIKGHEKVDILSDGSQLGLVVKNLESLSSEQFCLNYLKRSYLLDRSEGRELS